MCMLYVLLLLTTVQETGVLHLEYKCVNVQILAFLDNNYSSFS